MTNKSDAELDSYEKQIHMLIGIYNRRQGAGMISATDFMPKNDRLKDGRTITYDDVVAVWNLITNRGPKVR